MRSGWWWGTEEWNQYLQEYAKTRPECLNEWKSSPLAPLSHNFIDRHNHYEQTEHFSQVIDLHTHRWSDIRKSYRSLIHRGQMNLLIEAPINILQFRLVHHFAFGYVRSERSFIIQNGWMKSGNAMTVVASNKKDELVAAAMWIIYQGCAYYASGPSTERNAQHAVIWKSLQLLKDRGVSLVDMGQIDGETEKEKNIGMFKRGWGGEAKPFTIVRRI